MTKKLVFVLLLVLLGMALSYGDDAAEEAYDYGDDAAEGAYGYDSYKSYDGYDYDDSWDEAPIAGATGFSLSCLAISVLLYAL